VFEQIVSQLDALKQARQADQDTTTILANLKDLGNQATSLDKTVMDNFSQLESELLEKQLPAEIMQRHHDMVAHYQAQRNAWLEQLEAETDTGFFADLIRSFQNWIGTTPVTEQVVSPLQPADPTQFKRKHQPFNPDDLPNRALKPNPDNQPKVLKEEFIQSGLHNTPHTKLAALGDFTYDQLPGASDPAYLAESDEITLSQVIRDKAADLNYDPIQIHQFVRNNIEWVPSWGAIQNADLTLSARRGNTMDIASLTIALLRASQIPARYVHGTIDVPKDEFLNWAGGFTDINAAADFAASAGIPVTTIISGGQITKVRIEHVWVETAIDYFPSRGAKNKAADSWIQLDPSFKQYEYLEGLDSIAISGIDPEQLAQSFIDSGSINETEGWVTGFDPTILENAQAQAQQALEDHITNNLTDPTVGDVIGGRKTIIKEYPILPSSLPNQIVVEGTRYDKLPARLQQTIGWAFQRDILGDVVDAVTFPMAKVNNEKVTLSFKPATATDEAALESLLPEGEITDISQLPGSIPSHLIRVVPELKVNGEVVKTGGSMNLGEELDFITKVGFPHMTQPARTYSVIAGSFLSVNAVAQSVSPGKLADLQVKLEQTQQVLESGDQTQIDNLTREDIVGDMFQAGSLGYYAQLIALSHISGLQSDAHLHLAAGLGTVGYEPNVSYFFGIPRSIEPGGVASDIPFIQASQSSDGDRERLKQFNLQVGMLSSSLEHATPEQMFNTDPNNPPDAISAVKALQKASAAGQRIYQITQDNMNQVLGNIHHDINTMNEIRASLNVGKTVITHTHAVSVPGWSGAGYVILDPETNVGAWKIGGGSNGEWLEIAQEGLSKLVSLLSTLEKAVGKSGRFTILKKIIGQVKKFVENIKIIVDLAIECNPGWALLGVALYIGLIWVLSMIAKGLFLIAGLLSVAVCGPIASLCATALGVLISVTAIVAMNSLLNDTGNWIITQCREE
jgi:transglutaminase-like putative cysteine protease